MNYQLSKLELQVLAGRSGGVNSQVAARHRTATALLSLTLVFTLASCSKKPAELYKEGMKSFAAGNYEKSQENFSDGLRKISEEDPEWRGDSIYAGFIAANLVTGKYPSLISAYNDFSNGIHASLVAMYGQRAMKITSVASALIPYKNNGGNRLPPDFPLTVFIQSVADHRGFANIKQQIDSLVKK